MIDKKVNLLTGLVALAISIPSSLLFENSPIRALPFVFGIATFSLLVFVLTESYYALEKDGLATSAGPKFGRLLGQIYLGSKIVIGISLLLTGILFLIQFVAGLVSHVYRVDYKLLLPLILLAMIGGMFLRDPAAASWLDAKIKWLTPYVKAYNEKAIGWLEKAKPWVIRHNRFIAAGLIVIFVAIMLPLILAPVAPVPKELNIEMHDSLNVIERDYDQRLRVSIYNSGLEARRIFLEAEPEEGVDTLIMGFAGSGSNFEKIQAADIPAQSRQEFILVSHAATASRNTYPVKIKLFSFDKEDTDDSVQLVDSKTVNIKVLNSRIDLSYEVLGQDSTSLAKTIHITNKGATISDFSLLPDSSLQQKVRIMPEIKNMRFEKGAAVKVLVEPVLKLGFTSLKGNLLLAGGGASSPVELPLAFNAPDGKRLFLAVAACGSRNHTLISECINQRRNRVEMSAPPAFNGAEPHDVNTGVNPSSFTLPDDEGEIPGDTMATYEEAAPEYDSAQSEEVAGELERGRLYAGTTRPQILSRIRDLQQRFEALREDFEAGNAVERINRVIENLRSIVEVLPNDTPLTPEQIGRIDEMIQRAIDTYDLLNSEEVWNNRREVFISALGKSELTGSLNLRMDAPWLDLNNGAAPAIFFSSALTHFAWHRSHTTTDRVQSVHYSAHHADGKLSYPPFQMNAENEVGRWPSVVAGENGEVFFAWQGGSPGENHEIRLRVSNDGGKTWGATKQITIHSRGTYSPRMVYKNNRLFLMWTDFRNGVPQLMLSHSTDKGANFSQPVIVSGMVESNGVAKFDVGANHIHCVYEKKTSSGTRIFYNRIPIGALDGMYQFNEQDLTDGTHPSIIEAGGGQVHLAFVRGEGNSSEIYYTSSNDEGADWSELSRVTDDQVYSISPSVSLIDNSVRILYHSNIAETSKFIDHLYYVKKDNAFASWSEALRLPALTANGKRVFLSAKFKLPWDRRIYNRHNVKVFFNGKLLGSMNDNIPEGSILFPVDPGIIHHADFQNKKNVITLTTEHFNPAHYLATSEFALIADLSYIEQFIFAENQHSADEYLAKKSMFNHNEPDLGLYVDEQLRIPLQPREGEEINIKLRLWNLGDGECTNSTIDIYGGPANLSENSFQDRYILGQKRLGLIRPMENTTLNLSFTYWPGLEKVFIRVRTKEKDFETDNNVHVLTFAGPNGGPVDTYYGHSLSGGVLRVAVFDQPGELAKQADIQLYESGMLHPYKTSEKNPQVWLLPPGKYDVHIKKPGSSEIEQWIRGVNVWTAEQLRAVNSFENTISLDILMQKVENSLGDLEAVQSGNTITFTLPSSILFHSGQFEINPYAADFLKKIKTLLHAYQDSKLTIEGHTDRMGSTPFNLQLSEDRANAVKQWLIEIEGIEGDRLTTVGYGDSQPVADNDTESGRAKNRRVDFILNRTNP